MTDKEGVELNNQLAEQPIRSKRTQAMIDKFGSVEAYREYMRGLARKGGSAKVPKGGTSAGGKKGAATRMQRYGEDYQSELGRKGGQTRTRKLEES